MLIDLTKPLPEVPETKESFSRKYITSTEMITYLGISRPAFLYGRRSGKIRAKPISAHKNTTFIWERALVEDDLKNWKNAIQERQAA